MNVTPDLDTRFRGRAARGARRRALRRGRLAGRGPLVAATESRPLPHLVSRRRLGGPACARSSARACCARRSTTCGASSTSTSKARGATFDLPLDLRVAPFHADVLARARARPVRRARTTYGALATRGRASPKAARAVGTVMNRNPIPIVLPCHRIVGANGSLTGYAGGLDVQAPLCSSSRVRMLGVVTQRRGRRRRLRRAARGPRAPTRRRRGDARRPAELLPLPAARLPGGDRLALVGRGCDPAAANRLRRQKNARVVLGEATALDLARATRSPSTDLPNGGTQTRSIRRARRRRRLALLVLRPRRLGASTRPS